MQAVILAGGQGTRLKPYTDNHPKPMIEIEGIPFLEHLILQVKEWGIDHVLLLLGYKHEEIEQYFKDGSKWNIDISYSISPVESETGTRIRNAYELLDDEFLLMYCDNYCPIDYKKAYLDFYNSKNKIQLTAYVNKDGYTKNNLLVESGEVIIYDKKREADKLNGVDIGYAFMRKEAVNLIDHGNCNFEKSVYPKLVANKEIGCFLTEHRYYSIGSWKRMELTKDFFKPKKVVFLDRDGTMNVRPPQAHYVENPEQFIWLDGAKEAIKKLNDSGFHVYIITNQPGIARGNLTIEELDLIHKKMMDDLSLIGASIDDIFICPHNWNDGCDCRKPKPGMILEAQKKYSLNLNKCFLIGDDQRDIDAGIAAGIGRNILVNDTFSLKDAVDEIIG